MNQEIRFSAIIKCSSIISKKDEPLKVLCETGTSMKFFMTPLHMSILEAQYPTIREQGLLGWWKTKLENDHYWLYLDEVVQVKSKTDLRSVLSSDKSATVVRKEYETFFDHEDI
jgi:hypothetical protein